MTVIAERRIEHLLKGLPPDRQAEILAALHNEIAQEGHRRIEAEALRTTAAAVAAAGGIADGAEEFLAHLARLIRVQGCALALLEPDARFRVVGARGFPEPALPRTGSFATALTDRLTRGRVPVPLPDADVLGRHGRGAPAHVTGWAIPLLVDDEVRGFVTIRRSHADPFTPDQLRLAQGVIAAAGPALLLLQRLDEARRAGRGPGSASSPHAGEGPSRGRAPQRLRRVPQESEGRRQSRLLRRDDRPHS